MGITLFFVILTIGIQQLLVYSLRHGLLAKSAQAAPKGTLEKMKVVPFKPDAFAEHNSCSICLEDFGKDKEIRQTPCGHCFHKSCLNGWLTQSRTCPLCRTDLSSTAAVVPSQLG